MFGRGRCTAADEGLGEEVVGWLVNVDWVGFLTDSTGYLLGQYFFRGEGGGVRRDF